MATSKKKYTDEDGNKVVIDSNGKTVTSKDKSRITYNNKRGTTNIVNYGAYSGKGILNKKGNYDSFSDGEKQLKNKKGKNITYPDGEKRLTNKKGMNATYPDGSKRLTNQKGMTYKDSGSGSTDYKSFKKGITYTKDSSGKVTSDAPAKTTPAKPTPTKAPAKTVAQVWKEKTGKDWSEAKSLGLSDGSAASNMALLKKLKSGSLTNSDMSSSKFKDIGTLETKKLDTPKTELQTKRRGGSVTKMQTGGTTGAQLKKEGAAMKAKGMAMKTQGKAMKKIGSDMKPKTGMDGLKALAYHVKNMGVYKTGGMVNSNAKVTASKVAKGRPTKSAEPMSAAKKATGKTGGVSKAPRAAAPKMKMGGNMKRK